MNKTEEVYNFIEEYISINNYPPTVREICEKMKFMKFRQLQKN